VTIHDSEISATHSRVTPHLSHWRAGLYTGPGVQNLIKAAFAVEANRVPIRGTLTCGAWHGARIWRVHRHETLSSCFPKRSTMRKFNEASAGHWDGQSLYGCRIDLSATPQTPQTTGHDAL